MLNSKDLGVYTGPGDRLIIAIGRILGPFGVRGWLKVKTSSHELFSKTILISKSLLSNDWLEIDIVDSKPHGDTINLQLSNVDDRDKANAYRGYTVGVYRHQFPKLHNDEIYWVDLLGLAVVNVDGTKIGIVYNFIETGPHTVIVIKTDASDVLIPFVDLYILNTDLKNGVITVDWKYFD